MKLLRTLLLLTALIMGVELIHIWLVGTNLPPSKVTSTLTAQAFPAQLILDILYYLFALVFLHLCVALNSALSGFAYTKTGLKRENAEALGVFHFMLSWLLILILNQQMNPNSLFSGALPVNPATLNTILLVVGFLFLLLQVIAIYSLARSGTPILIHHRKSGWLLLGFLGGIFLLSTMNSSRSVDSVTHPKPHILIIGIDSLRYDALTEASLRSLVPNIQAFIDESAHFETAITPLARTYPSWMSLLTGQNPRSSGVRANLISPDSFEITNTLVYDLKNLGYSTVYATDERRFSNIDESHGFDAILGPDYGAADFAIGFISDFPLTNLIAATHFGSYIFPFVTYNRALPQSYHPNLFSDYLSEFLRTARFDQPLFLATHFCLPHWPYTWAQSTLTRASTAGMDINTALSANNLAIYKESLKKVDAQVGQYLVDLEAAGLLENTLVIMLSDHGEDFQLPMGSLVSLDESGKIPGPRVGHGTNVLLPAQNRVVLGFRYYGTAITIPAGKRSQVTSLIDLRPTILDWLHSEPSTSDGISLTSWLVEPTTPSQPRLLEMETGFEVPAINAANINIQEVIRQGISFYRISADGRLELSPEFIDKIIQAKKFAVTDGTHTVGMLRSDETLHWYLADWEMMTIQSISGSDDLNCDQTCKTLFAETQERFGLQ